MFHYIPDCSLLVVTHLEVTDPAQVQSQLLQLQKQHECYITNNITQVTVINKNHHTMFSISSFSPVAVLSVKAAHSSTHTIQTFMMMTVATWEKKYFKCDLCQTISAHQVHPLSLLVILVLNSTSYSFSIQIEPSQYVVLSSC